jgi:hypothetical protein
MENYRFLNGEPCPTLKLNQIVAPVFFSGKFLKDLRKTNDRPGDVCLFFWNGQLWVFEWNGNYTLNGMTSDGLFLEK